MNTPTYRRRTTYNWGFDKMAVGEQWLLDPHDADKAAKALVSNRRRGFSVPRYEWAKDLETGALLVVRAA